MATFTNRIRLPFYLRQPQFPTEFNQFRLADGTTKTISAIVRKTYGAITDQMHESILQKLAIALAHDTINIEGPKYAGGVAMDGEFQIVWQDFLDYPLGVAQFTVQVTPFSETNSNCQTCEEANQLNLEDDEIYGDLSEGETAVINVFANDVICCSPITAEIVSFNSAFVDTITIDPLTGDATIQIKNPAPSGTDILLATYRVTCPNGGYDDANIYGSVAGSEPSCEAPSGLAIEDMDADLGTANATFTPSPSGPLGGYEWALYTCADLVTPVQTGNVAGSPIPLSALSPGQCYRLVIAAVCVPDVFYSSAIFVEFTMPAPVTNCGGFILENGDPFGPEPFLHVTYMDCNGDLQNISVRTPRSICALTDAYGNAIYLAVDFPGLLISPTGPC